MCNCAIRGVSGSRDEILVGFFGFGIGNVRECDRCFGVVGAVQFLALESDLRRKVQVIRPEILT